MNEPKTFILWGREDLISRAVELLLTAHKEWNVIRVSNEQDLNILYQEVDDLKPSAVVITELECEKDRDLPIRLLKDHPGLKIITISLGNNMLAVYNRQIIKIKKVDDLISVMEN